MTSSTKVCSNHNLLGGAGRGGEAPTSVLSRGRQQQRFGGGGMCYGPRTTDMPRSHKQKDSFTR